MSEKPKDKNATVEDTDYGFQRQVGLLMFALSIECVKSFPLEQALFNNL